MLALKAHHSHDGGVPSAGSRLVDALGFSLGSALQARKYISMAFLQELGAGGLCNMLVGLERKHQDDNDGCGSRCPHR